MKLKMVFLNVDFKNSYVELDLKNLQDFPSGFRSEDKTVLAIDPGSNSMGFSIGRKDKKIPMACGVFKRDRKMEDEIDTDMYIVKAVQMICRMSLQMKVDAVIIEDQFLDPKLVDSYRILTTMKDSLRGNLQVNGIKDINLIKPTTWKADFLSEYKSRYNINLNASNKEWVMKKSRELYDNMYAIKENDASDSLGMLMYYYNYIYTDKGGILTSIKDLKRDHKHNLICSIGKVSTYEKIFEGADKFKEKYNREELKIFKINENMTIDDNLRGFTTSSKDVYLSFFKPFMTAMPEIYKNKDKIGKISKNTELYCLGMRAK